MRTLRSALGGALALVMLQVLVQTAPASRVAGLLGVPAKFAARFLDPDVPALPERRRPNAITGGAAGVIAAAQSAYPDPFEPRAPQGVPNFGG